MSYVMKPKYKLLPDGGFVAGDPATGVTSYAYPTSDCAKQARKHDPESVARAMLTMEEPSFRAVPSVKEYDSRNWETLNKEQRRSQIMAYTRKTRDEYEIQQYTGLLYGWEVVCTEDTYKEARARKSEYRENQPEYGVRIVKKRVKIELRHK